MLLDLLRDRPRHGYDLIRELEERSGGYYSPSPGTIYPTLQMLEDMGHVTSRDDEGRRVYHLTPEGAAYLDEHREHVERHRARMSSLESPGGRESAELLSQLKRLFREIAEASWRQKDQPPEKLAALREILERTKRDIDALNSD